MQQRDPEELLKLSYHFYIIPENYLDALHKLHTP